MSRAAWVSKRPAPLLTAVPLELCAAWKSKRLWRRCRDRGRRRFIKTFDASGANGLCLVDRGEDGRNVSDLLGRNLTIGTRDVTAAFVGETS
jgi:hypothetical protein